MPEAQVAAPSAQPQSISIAQAAQMYAEKVRPAEQANPVSDAARTLGQHAHAARLARTTAAAVPAQKPLTEAGSNVEDDQANPDGEAQDGLTTENTDTPDAEAPEGQDDPDSRTIDLGEGVSMTLAEVRENIMLKADHTRRLQALAEDRKQLESERSQKLARLDNIVETLSQKIGKPKSLTELVKELGPLDAVEKFAEQQDEMSRLEAAKGIAERQRKAQMSQDLSARDKALAESYNPEWADQSKRDAAYTQLTEYALKLGANPETLRYMPEPWMIQVLDQAHKYAALKASGNQVTKAIGEKPKVIKPGTKLSAQGSAFNNLQSAQARLKSSGSLADAVLLLQAKRGSRG